MKNIVDRLNEKIKELKSPIVVGLDPVLAQIPDCYKVKLKQEENKFKAISDILINFNKDIIDSIYDIVPAVKPQMAFYEMYGEYGVKAFIETVKYAKQKGMFVIADAKRNDIGNTANGYAKGFLGKVDIGNGIELPVYDADFLTVSPYLGLDSIEPFINECKANDKGIFILVKTSNPSSADIQDKIDKDGKKICEIVAGFVKDKAEECIGEGGYTSIGAVVGATFPEEAQSLRKIMDNNIFLVPGYGAQGATAKDITNSFNSDGFGAIVNASRSVIYAYKKEYDAKTCTIEQYKDSARQAALNMKEDIISALQDANKMFKE